MKSSRKEVFLWFILLKILEYTMSQDKGKPSGKPQQQPPQKPKGK